MTRGSVDGTEIFTTLPSAEGRKFGWGTGIVALVCNAPLRSLCPLWLKSILQGPRYWAGGRCIESWMLELAIH
jgi:hypothetical protein